MGETEFRELCTNVLIDYIRTHLDPTEDVAITTDKIFCVWMVKALQNNKALYSTRLPDGMYYEFTYNGDRNELYMDVYRKQRNVCVKVGEEHGN